MSINLTVPDDKTHLLKPKLTVIGVGGAGGNAINNMIRAELEGVDFVVANTDSQALSQSGTQRRIQLGSQLTEGLGAGSRPEVGRAAAEESLDEIIAELEGAHMAFIAAGMGEGTGPGGCPGSQGKRHSDCRRRHQTVPIRGHASHVASRGGDRGFGTIR